MTVEIADRNVYLEDLPELMIHSQEISALAEKLFQTNDSELEIVRKAFLFIRDEIAHSWDIQQTEVTKTSLDVLRARHGICYVKANLLAAILRQATIPTGFCYQRLLLFDKEAGKYCLHALNAVYLQTQQKWLKLDARGDKAGIVTDFDGETEYLAFVPNIADDEWTYATIYAKPHEKTMFALEEATNISEMYRKDLPESI